MYVYIYIYIYMYVCISIITKGYSTDILVGIFWKFSELFQRTPVDGCYCIMTGCSQAKGSLYVSIAHAGRLSFLYKVIRRYI